jgi:hypothetical protein
LSDYSDYDVEDLLGFLAVRNESGPYWGREDLLLARERPIQ